MAIIILVIFCCFIIFWIISPNNEKIKKENHVQELITKGELIQLQNGLIKKPSELSPFEKMNLPDYIYLVNYGKKYGYSFLDSMTVEQLKSAANFVRFEIGKEALIKQQIEREFIKQEQERKNKENILRLQREIEENRLKIWHQLKSKVIFEIDKSVFNSNKAGLYVIHCNKNNQIYIGSSLNMLKRKTQHLSNLKTGKHHSFKLQKLFDEYNENFFKFYALEIIEEKNYSYSYPDNNEKLKRWEFRKSLKDREQELFSSYKPELNIEDDSTGSRHWNGKYNYWKR